MLQGIRDTSAQDVAINKPNRLRWLKWAVASGGMLALAALLLSVLTTWLSADAIVLP